jgi:hypothetical protein
VGAIFGIFSLVGHEGLSDHNKRRTENRSLDFAQTNRPNRHHPFSGHETKNRKIEVFVIREIVVETVLVFFVLELVLLPRHTTTTRKQRR